MKKLLSILLLFCSVTSFGADAMEEYRKAYPFSNPYDATILGSSMLMTEGVSEKAKPTHYSIESSHRDIPDILWRHREFRFSLIKQKEKADLVFLLAGTGSDYDSLRMKLLQRILYDAGFHVLSFSSQMTVNFLTAVSTTHIPGVLEEDAKDMYAMMQKAYHKIEKEIDVKNIHLVGYSLGATNAAFLSALDQKEGKFHFDRVFMINPAVELYSSARKLDKYLDKLVDRQGKNLYLLFEHLLARLRSNLSEYSSSEQEDMLRVFQEQNFTDEQKAALVGMAFRVNAMDLNFSSDLLAKTGAYTDLDEKLGKFSSTLHIFSKLKFSNFEDYMLNVAIPYYRKLRDIASSSREEEKLKEELIEASSLRKIAGILREKEKIHVVTNADELILSEEDHAFLKETFGERLLLYPVGGHCGNMFFAPNVKHMIEYLKGGK